jgi:hypothetical protein
MLANFMIPITTRYFLASSVPYIALGIVLIELLLFWLVTGRRHLWRCMHVVAVVNLVSTVAGIPLTFFLSPDLYSLRLDDWLLTLAICFPISVLIEVPLAIPLARSWKIDGKVALGIFLGNCASYLMIGVLALLTRGDGFLFL